MTDITVQGGAIKGARTRLHAIVWSRRMFWLLLSLPAWPLVVDLWPQHRYFAETMHITGVLSAQLLVATLCVTPLSLLIRRWNRGRVVGRWLLPRRRYLGLASAGYAALHTAHYIRYEADLGSVFLEAADVEFLVGWVAMIVFIPLAATSNGWCVRRLGKHWKTLQRFVYLAAAGAFLHWYLFDRRPSDLYLWFAALVAIKLGHIALRWRQAAAPKRSS